MIASAIYSILSNDSNITSVVGTRIYPDVLPMGVDQPAIIYNLSDSGFLETKTEAAQTNHELQILIGNAVYDQVNSLSKTIRTALFRKTGTFENVKIQRFTYMGAEEKGWNEDLQLHMKELKFEIIENL